MTIEKEVKKAEENLIITRKLFINSYVVGDDNMLDKYKKEYEMASDILLYLTDPYNIN